MGRPYSPVEAVEPLGRLKARLGVFAILGNNDSGERAFELALPQQA